MPDAIQSTENAYEWIMSQHGFVIFLFGIVFAIICAGLIKLYRGAAKSYPARLTKRAATSFGRGAKNAYNRSKMGSKGPLIFTDSTKSSIRYVT